ncbi:BA14K family protein [Pararhizobium mangrovi]|uniref:Lectin-like protein BA14k n=1 Tax=Pararhizobium mangrovi TaxID=2590452 RepID=A0A506U7I8_9HYPH|nr:BA14K family protein [Pararhizobium mangrovi]TPW30382.1 BA14K family protein [Pararhizobium mangrovi]
MKNLVKAFVLSAAVAATALVPLSSAQARDWHHHRYYYHHHNDGLALGALGLATGAIIGGAIASDRPRTYYEVDPPVRYYRERPVEVYRPAPVYTSSIQPWTNAWYNYCENRYRSFDARSGTFRGYDGQNHFCVAN